MSPRMSDDDVLGIALRVARAIEEAGGQYFVGGSLASSLDGDPRTTNDVDFVVDMPLGRVAALREALGADFEVDVDVLRATLHGGGCAGAKRPRLSNAAPGAHPSGWRRQRRASL